MSIRRITRDRRLTPEEAAKYNEIRKKVAEELPDLIARHCREKGKVEKGEISPPEVSK